MGDQRTREIFDRQLEKERTATLQVSYAAVEIQAPHVNKGEYEQRPIKAWAVRVWEKSPPATGTKLEWFLVCLEPVTNAAEAWQKADWYACRWIEEEYHKAQKTGCRIEDLQFRTEAALQPMIALLSVTAILLLNLRQAARQPDAQERKATRGGRADLRRSVACLASQEAACGAECVRVLHGGGAVWVAT